MHETKKNNSIVGWIWNGIAPFQYGREHKEDYLTISFSSQGPLCNRPDWHCAVLQMTSGVDHKAYFGPTGRSPLRYRMAHERSSSPHAKRGSSFARDVYIILRRQHAWTSQYVLRVVRDAM